MRHFLSAAGAAVVAGAILWSAPAFSDFELNMAEGVTTSSREIYSLHMQILLVCAVIAAGVYAAMIYAILKFRKSKGAVPAKFSHSTTAEIIWTVIPSSIQIAMAVHAADTLVRLEDTRNSEITLTITGYPWQWQYDNIDQCVAFFRMLDRVSNATRQPGSGRDRDEIENYLLEVINRVVVPVDTKIRLLITAADVLHAWWVPDLGV